MAGPTPEQVIAVNALLQQALQSIEAQNAATQQQAFPVNIQSTNLGVNLNALTRALTIDGSAAVSANLDQILIRTAGGDVLLKVQQTQDQQLLNLLPSRVTLQLRPGPDGLQAFLVVGNNRAIAPDKPVESLAAGTAFAGNQTLTAQIPKINQINQALVLPSSLFSAHTPEEFLAQLGAQVQGKQLPVSTPAQSQTQNFVSSLLQRMGFIPQPVQANMPQLPNAPGLPLPVLLGQNVAAPSLRGFSAPLPGAPQATAIKILGVITPDAAQKIQTAAAFTTPVTADEDGAEIAIVRGNTPSGQPVVSVGDKFIAVQGAKNWPVGMQLKVLMGPAAGLVTEGDESSDIRAFSGLRAALEAMATLSPATYNDVARLRMPQANAAQMPGALLFLFSALQKGMPAWLGEEFAEKMKEFGKEQLIRVISDQWRAQMGQEAEGPGGQWRGITIPIFDQERMQQLKFYVYDPPDQRGRKSNRDPNSARRFLIDFSLTRLGPIQLDGLVHKKRLDLVVRTSRAFDSDLRNELVAHFHRTLEEVRYAGDLRFTANKMGWVEIRDKSKIPLMRDM